jgi:hypothetical protein
MISPIVGKCESFCVKFAPDRRATGERRGVSPPVHPSVSSTSNVEISELTRAASDHNQEEEGKKIAVCKNGAQVNANPFFACSSFSTVKNYSHGWLGKPTDKYG